MRPEAFPRLRAPMCRDGMEPLLVAYLTLVTVLFLTEGIPGEWVA